MHGDFKLIGKQQILKNDEFYRNIDKYREYHVMIDCRKEEWDVVRQPGLTWG